MYDMEDLLFKPEDIITRKEDCPLCIRKRINKIIYEDPRFWVTFCSVHPDCPLIVLKEHRDMFTGEERQWVEWFVSVMWPEKRIRWTIKSLPEHIHCHVEL